MAAVALLSKGSKGADVVELKHLLEAWGEQHPLPEPLAETPVFGKATTDAVTAFQLAQGLDPDGRVGDLTWRELVWATGGAAKQIPPLPAAFSHPDVPPYVQGDGWAGLQPWIVPQVEAVCAHFHLQVTAGFGGHPPHALHSDHGWGGGVDFAGEEEAMEACNLWADDHCADPFREGMVFRWVGGPAKDSSGVEPGHTDHVHLSWYRTGPATSVFDLPEFS